MFAESVRSSGNNWDKVQYVDKKANDGKKGASNICLSKNFEKNLKKLQKRC